MNRRGFFGWMTAAAGWMVGVKAQAKPKQLLVKWEGRHGSGQFIRPDYASNWQPKIGMHIRAGSVHNYVTGRITEIVEV
jgi:hypothetical protein